MIQYLGMLVLGGRGAAPSVRYGYMWKVGFPTLPRVQLWKKTSSTGKSFFISGDISISYGLFVTVMYSMRKRVCYKVKRIGQFNQGISDVRKSCVGYRARLVNIYNNMTYFLSSCTCIYIRISSVDIHQTV